MTDSHPTTGDPMKACATMRPVFTYWDNKDLSPLSEVIAHWARHSIEFRVIGDIEVCEILERVNTNFIETYERIRIPAARSDLARLAALYDYGGLYVDSHCGIRAQNSFENLPAPGNASSLVLVDEDRSRRPRPDGQYFLLNAIIGCARRNDHIAELLNVVMTNFTRQRELEEISGFVEYDLLRLSGPFVFTSTMTGASSNSTMIRSDLVKLASIAKEEDFFIKRYVFEMPRSKGAHWSERQKTELLFER